MPDKQLKMSFQPTVIEHLGVKMYSHTVPAIAELVANAYDAGATVAEVLLYDKPEHKIVIKDDGTGMSFDEINDFYLRIGRNRRRENQPSCLNRKPTGKKGLGKLALFGLGNRIEISTVKDGEQVTFILDYADILQSEGDYEPKFDSNPVDSSVPNGTVITLTELTKKQGYPLDNYTDHLARLFDFPDPNFIIKISLNDGEPKIIDSMLKYKSVTPQFEWKYEELILTDVLAEKAEKYMSSGLIKGKFITTEKPLKNNMKGITLFANGRMVNAPEFFRSSESSHFYSYLTGWLNVDFIDDDHEDLISTDRTSLDWKQPITTMLRSFLGEVVAAIASDWRKKRKEKKDKKIKNENNIDLSDWQSKLPNEVQKSVQEILKGVDESELTETEQVKVIKALHELVPEYPYYHWRHLHQDLHSACEDYYNVKKDYLNAAIEAVKVLEIKVQEKTNLKQDGATLFDTAFGSGKSVLLLTNNTTQSEKNLEDGLQKLVGGVWTGFRNPLQHDLRTNLYPEIFNDKDALDILSLVSYLIKKTEQTKKRNKE